MDARKPALAIALVGSLIMSEPHMIHTPPSAQTPVQFVGGSELLTEPDHTHHEAETKDIDETSILVATASAQAWVMPSETLK
jgi:hypothetical protein